ncbi:hypothetical protein BN1723_017466, partial [Verticillium longisporum]
RQHAQRRAQVLSLPAPGPVGRGHLHGTRDLGCRPGAVLQAHDPERRGGAVGGGAGVGRRSDAHRHRHGVAALDISCRGEACHSHGPPVPHQQEDRHDPLHVLQPRGRRVVQGAAAVDEARQERLRQGGPRHA